MGKDREDKGVNNEIKRKMRTAEYVRSDGADVVCLGLGRMRSSCHSMWDGKKTALLVEVLCKMKDGKVLRVEKIAVGLLKNGGDGAVELLVRVFDMCMGQGEVPKVLMSVYSFLFFFYLQ